MSLSHLCIEALGASVSLLSSQLSTQDVLENYPGMHVALSAQASATRVVLSWCTS